MGWQWTQESWATWTGRLKRDWSQALADAWEDTQRAVGADVQASPDEAARLAEKMHRDLFATDTDPGGPGIWWNISLQWSEEARLLGKEKASEVRLEDAERLYAGLSQRLGVPAADLTGDAAMRRAGVLTLGLLKGSQPNQELEPEARPGFAPLIIGGLVLSFGAACWAWVRGKQAEVELDRIALSREALQALKEDATRSGKLDTDAVARVVGSAAAPPSSGASGVAGAGGGSGTLLMVGGAVVLVGLGAYLFSRRS